MIAGTLGSPPPRSWLYVPAHDERKVEKAASCQADAIILDLEDGTPDGLKAEAQVLVNATLASAPSASQWWVRINAVDERTDWRGDLAALVGASALHGVVIPKVAAAATINAVNDELRRLGLDLPLAPIITETADAALSMGATLRTNAPLTAAIWGTEDLQSDLGAQRIRNETGELVGAYAVVEGLFLLETARAGIAAIDTPTLELDDLDRVARESRRAAAFGFAGRQAIHPKHLEIINEAFSPTERDLRRAEEIVRAFGNETSGAHRVGSEMVDTPHLRSARFVIDRVRAYGVQNDG